MLRIPEPVARRTEFARELADECMATSEERSMVYTRAAQYYYTGSSDMRAAIYNKVKTFVDRLAGYLFLPGSVRFNVVYGSHEPPDVLERGRIASQMLTAEYRASDTDLRFSDCVTWALINGSYLLKHLGDEYGFRAIPVHPVNFGVLQESVVSLAEQEAFCHVTYPTISRLRADLERAGVPKRDAIIRKIEESRHPEKDQNEPSYFHQMVVGGLNPLGDVNSSPEAAGIVQVFPTPTPWQPQRRHAPTVRHCELWIKDAAHPGNYSTLQLIYPDILIEGDNTGRNIMGGPKLASHHPFVKVEAETTPGYFWGRSVIALIQMMQDVLSKRLRDIKVMWDRNAAAPYAFAGFQSITEEQYYKLISEGGFVSDPNPNAKATKLTEPPPQGYLEELEFIVRMYDEAGGFTPVLSGQGESGVRAGVHAQTLVRTSSPALIDPATRIERQLAESGDLGLRLMQDVDAGIYQTEKGQDFTLDLLPEPFTVEVDSHSASPAFAEDSRQLAIALARAQAISAEDLIEMLHPPNAELLLARLRQRQQAQAQAAQQAAAMGQPPPGQQQQHGRRSPATH